MSVRTAFRRLAAAAGAVVLAAAVAPPARGQAIIKVNDTVGFKVGFAIQGWADWNQDAVTGGYAQNLFIRRLSLYFAGQIARGVTVFVRTDSPNLGKPPKNFTSNFIIEDGYLEWEPTPEFILDGGVILIPFCRNCLEYSVRQLSLDYGSYSFLANGLTESSVARDSGFQAKGYLFGQRLEYRVGAFQGHRDPGSRNSFRSAGRLQYNFFETEKAQFYPGTYLGTKKILAVGAAYDLQADYRAYAADAFLDLPTGGGNGVTGQVDVLRWDGGTTFPTLARQNDLFFEGGFYFASVRLLPWARYERQSFSSDADSIRDQQRFQAGVTWYRNAHNFNVRAAWSRVIPKAAAVPSTNEFTIQVQVFYF